MFNGGLDLPQRDAVAKNDRQRHEFAEREEGSVVILEVGTADRDRFRQPHSF